LVELLRRAPTRSPALWRDSVVAVGPGYRTVSYHTRVKQTWYFDSTRTTRH
jgi:hypothetical protein